MQDIPFAPYACSVGTVVGHDGGHYLIATADGRTIGIPAAGEPSAAAVETDVAAWAPPTPTPRAVRNSQLRQWLLEQPGSGGGTMLADVEARFADPAQWPDEVTRQKALVRWEQEPNVVREDPLVVMLAADLGLTAEDVDAAFREIAAIP